MSDKTARSLATACEWLLMAAFVVFFSALSLTKHAAFQTHGFDLGNYDQTVWNTLHGRILACTNWPPFGNSRLAFHVEPILIPIAPLYLIYEGPQTLLVLQAVVTGLGAWPVAQIARRRFSRAWAGPLFAAIYLLYPALEAGPTFEFHGVTLAATFLAMALYTIETEHYSASIPWLVLAASCKEEISLLVAMLGLYLIFIRRRWKLGAAVLGLSLMWFFLCVQVILPYFNPQGESAHLGRYTYLGGSVPDIAVNMVRRPERVWNAIKQPARFAYLWRIPLPTGYLALLAPEILLLALPTIAINVLSMFSAMYALDFVHYSVPLVPFVVVAAVYGGARLLDGGRRLLPNVDERFLLLLLGGYLLFTSLFYHRTFGHTPLARSFRWPQLTEHHRIGQEVLGKIPDDAAVSAQMSLNPHVSQREQIFVFPQYEKPDYFALDVTALDDNGFSLTPPSADGRSDSRYYNPGLSQADYLRLVRDLLDDPQWGVEESRDGLLVLREGASREEPSHSFYEPFLGCEAVKTSPLQISFGDSLELKALSLEPGRWAGQVLHTCWQGNRRSRSDLIIYLVLVDRSLNPIQVVKAQEMTTSALVPSSLWRSGQEIHDQALIHFPSDPQRYGLGLLVGVEGAVEHSEKRLPVSPDVGQDWIGVDQAARVLLLRPRRAE